MKKLLIMTILFCSGLAIVSCDRTALNLETPLGVSKTSTIKKGEPVDFSFNSDANADRISWQVTPNRNVRMNADGKNARILFGEAGIYTVTAADQEITSRTAVTVDSTTYVPQDTLDTSDTLTTSVPEDTTKTSPPKPEPPKPQPPVVPTDTVKKAPVDAVGTHNIYVSLVGDHFTLAPSIVDTLSIAGLALRIESQKSYTCLNSYLTANQFSKNPVTNITRLSMYYVTQPGARYCQEGSRKVSVNTIIYPLIEGENKIEIALNGHIYSGKVVLRDKNFTIDWPDTSEVSFTKLILNK